MLERRDACTTSQQWEYTGNERWTEEGQRCLSSIRLSTAHLEESDE